MDLHMYDMIRRPSITEKNTRFQESHGKYAFEVHPDANKKQIKSAIEKIFNVHVEKVNTMNYQGKWRRLRFQAGKTRVWKRAIVTLKKGEKIDVTA